MAYFWDRRIHILFSSDSSTRLDSSVVHATRPPRTTNSAALRSAQHTTVSLCDFIPQLPSSIEQSPRAPACPLESSFIDIRRSLYCPLCSAFCQWTSYSDEKSPRRDRAYYTAGRPRNLEMDGSRQCASCISFAEYWSTHTLWSVSLSSESCRSALSPLISGSVPFLSSPPSLYSRLFFLLFSRAWRWNQFQVTCWSQLASSLTPLFPT